MLARYGLAVAGDLVDTMVAEWLIDPGSRGLGLKDLAWTRLKTEMTPISALIGSRQESDHHGQGARGRPPGPTPAPTRP